MGNIPPLKSQKNEPLVQGVLVSPFHKGRARAVAIRLPQIQTYLESAQTMLSPQSKKISEYVCFIKQNFSHSKIIELLNTRLNLLEYRGDIKEVLSELEYETLIRMFLDKNPQLEIYYSDTEGRKYLVVGTKDLLIQFIAKIYDI